MPHSTTSKDTDQSALFPVSREDLAMLLKQYGISNFSAELLSEGKNRTLKITAGSECYILRIYRPGAVSDSFISQELDFMNFVVQPPLRTPRVILAPSGERLQHVQSHSSRWQYLLMEFIPGKHPENYSSELIFQMALLQAIMHQRGRAFARKSTLHKRRLPIVRSIPQIILERFVPTGYSHFDFDASNLLMQDGTISGIIDFEGMRYGPLAGCLYFTLSQIFERHHNPAKLTQYLEAYQQIRKLNFREKIIIRSRLALRYKRLQLLWLPTHRGSQAVSR